MILHDFVSSHIKKNTHTCDEGGHAPTNQVVEPHRSIVDISHFADHAVDVQRLQEEPGEGAEVEEVQQNGHDCAQKLPRGGGGGWGRESRSIKNLYHRISNVKS